MSVGDEAAYTIGAEVTCGDGVCGELRRVVVDPVAHVLTHLVVDPKHRPGLERLVPIALVDESAEGICLRCSTAEFDGLESAEETHFLPEAGQQMGYGAGQVLTWPYYGLGGGLGGVGMDTAYLPVAISEDRVPQGEVELRRGERVQASDGEIGRVHGLVIHPHDHRVTHVLLAQGHLWGKHEVAIPVSAVKDVTTDGVRLDLTKDEIRNLPPVELADRG
jgi:hypothetical protein